MSEDFSKGIPYWFSSLCQICILDNKFPDFEKEVEKIQYNMVELRPYLDKVQNEVIKCYYDDPFSTEAFLIREYCFCSKNYREGTWWHVSLSESIRYVDKMGDDVYGPFHDEE